MSAQLQIEQASYAPMRMATRKVKMPIGSYILRNLSFSVQQRDRLSIVGASGCGKSSLLRLLNRLIDPAQGKLYFNGTNYTKIPIVELRQNIVLVPQEPKLLSMTVRQALEYPLTLRNLAPTEIEARVKSWCDRLHIPAEWMNRTDVQLSVGERQWIAIARALLCESPVLLLDEPTASLDVGRQDHLLNVLSDLSSGGQTIAIATHQLDFAARWSDRVLHLQRGELLDDRSDVNWDDLRHAIAQIEADDAAEWD